MVTGLGYMGDGPTPSSAWSAACPGQCSPQGGIHYSASQ